MPAPDIQLGETGMSGIRNIRRLDALGISIFGFAVAIQMHAQSSAGGAVLEVRVTDGSGRPGRKRG